MALTDRSEALNVDSRHWSCLWILHFCRLGFKMCTVPFLWIIFISWTNKQRRRFIWHLNRRLTSWSTDGSKKGTKKRHFRDLWDHKVFGLHPGPCVCMYVLVMGVTSVGHFRQLLIDPKWGCNLYLQLDFVVCMYVCLYVWHYRDQTVYVCVGGGSCVCQSFCQHKHGPQMDGMIVAEAIVISHTPSCSPTRFTPKLRLIP